MLTASGRLNATHWTADLNVVPTVAFLGAIAGLALGYSLFSVSVVRLYVFIYGAFTVVWQVGSTMGDGVLWQERLISMGNRLLIILDDIIRQKPVSDNLLFVLLMAILFWAISTFAGYSVTRYGNPWRAILPAGLALIIIQAYDALIPNRAWFIAGYVFLGLMLIARMHFLKQNRRWKQNGTYLPPFAGLDSVRLALILTAGMVLFAWSAPALASAMPPAAQVWQRATAPWLAVRNRLSNAFASLQASAGVVTDFYGDTLNLGRGNPLTDSVVLTVETQTRLRSGERYYWRARVYDSYDGSWISTLPAVQEFTPEDYGLNFPEYEGRDTVRFALKTSFPIQNLYAPAEPVWVSRPVQAQVARNADGTTDLGQLRATPLLRPGDIYEVDSSLSSATIAQLRAAGDDYPSWVTDRYLQLPETITPRTRQLAEQIAASLETPYDRAQAITDFLRNNIEYSETIPLPPADQEAIDWLLFDHRQGFCNYYATAEVVLLRALGIPARLAVGYAQGERQSLESPEIGPALRPGDDNLPQDIAPVEELYVVRHRDLHAWPEVYFPNAGWVEFEPTVNQAPIIRPIGDQIPTGEEQTGPDPSAIDQEHRLELDEFLNQQSTQSSGENNFGLEDVPTWAWFLITISTLVLVILILRQVRIRRGSPPLAIQFESGLKRIGVQPPPLLRRWARLAGLSPLGRAYLELNRALTRLGKPPAMVDTPAERGETLKYILPVAVTPVNHLVGEYQAAIYGNQPGNPELARESGMEIRKLSYLARLQRSLARFQEPVDKQKSRRS
jgi:transglutaminase-like putative cysteine protease